MQSELLLIQQAYVHIPTEMPTDGLGAGSRISQQEIKDDLGISRTPVGEAIRLLAEA
jgi:DNA-binding GntR family transcriptional regulator